MNESAHSFGRWDNLVGVFNSGESPQQPICVLMLTPGMLHHVGPYRLHVQLARQLSARNVPSLRFCLSGIGESLGVGASGSSIQRAVDEIGQAMDWLESEHGLNRFVTFGLCSGADDSLYAALFDSRIVGLSMLDGCGYTTVGHYIRRGIIDTPRKIWQRLKSISHGGSLLHRQSFANASTLATGNDIREFPARQTAEKDLVTLVNRGVEMLFMYTGGVSNYFNGVRQFDEMFPRLKGCDKIICQYHAHLDHVAQLQEDRELVIESICNWLSLDRIDRILGQFQAPDHREEPRCNHLLPV